VNSSPSASLSPLLLTPSLPLLSPQTEISSAILNGTLSPNGDSLPLVRGDLLILGLTPCLRRCSAICPKSDSANKREPLPRDHSGQLHLIGSSDATLIPAHISYGHSVGSHHPSYLTPTSKPRGSTTETSNQSIDSSLQVSQPHHPHSPHPTLSSLPSRSGLSGTTNEMVRHTSRSIVSAEGPSPDEDVPR
jgi:hypothetical protein